MYSSDLQVLEPNSIGYSHFCIAVLDMYYIAPQLSSNCNYYL